MRSFKKAIILLGAAVFLLSMTMGSLWVSAAGENLVINPGFEEAESTETLIPGWTPSNPYTGTELSSIMSYSTDEKVSGERSLCIVHNEVKAVTLQQDYTIDSATSGGKYMRYSLYAKNVSSGRASVDYIAYYYNDQGAFVNITTNMPIAISSSWAYVTHLQKLPAETVKLRIIIKNYGPASGVAEAKMFVDDASICEVGNVGANMIYNGGLEETYTVNNVVRPVGNYPSNFQLLDSPITQLGAAYARTGNIGLHVDAGAAYRRNVVETNNVNGIADFAAGDALRLTWQLRSNTETRYQLMCCAGTTEGSRIADTGTWVTNPGNGMLYMSSTAGAWTEKEYTFVVPEGCTYLKFIFFTMQSDTTGYADFDDFTLVKDETSVKHTMNNVAITSLAAGDVVGICRYVSDKTEAEGGRVVTLVTALYKKVGNENVLADIKLATDTVYKGTPKVITNDAITVPAADIGNYSLKTLIWNGFVDLMPYSDAVIVLPTP